MVPLPVVVFLLPVVFASALFLGRIFPFFQPKSVKDTIELINVQYKAEKEARLNLEAQMRDQELRHVKEIGELNGRLDILSSDFAKALALKAAPIAAPIIAKEAVPLIVKGVKDAIAS